MNKIKFFVKLLISLILIATLVYAISTFFILSPTLVISEHAHLLVMLINALIIIYLIVRLFRFKNLSIETKILWFLIFIFLSPLILYYVWVADDKLVAKENWKL